MYAPQCPLMSLAHLYTYINVFACYNVLLRMDRTMGIISRISLLWLASLLCLAHASSWIPCGNPRVCHCMSTGESVQCFGNSVTILPNFSDAIHRTALALFIEDTELQSLGRLTLNAWSSLKYLSIKNNPNLIDCMQERIRIKGERETVTVNIECPGDIPLSTTEEMTAASTINSDSTLISVTAKATMEKTTLYDTENTSLISTILEIMTTESLPQTNIGLSVSIPLAVFTLVILVGAAVAYCISRKKRTDKITIPNIIYLGTTESII